MFHFLPIAIRYDGSAPAGGHGYQVHIGPMYSDSRGTVKLTSAEPFDKPALRFNYLSTPTDRAEWTEAIAIARRILNQPAFDEFNAGELSPGPSVSAEAEVLDWVARDAETALHPSCTCAMGTGPLSVTDPLSLAVHGVSRAAGGRRVRHALCHQRKHLRADDDDRGEGGRPDHGEHAAVPHSNSLLSP